jgi:hypothetical protein
MAGTELLQPDNQCGENIFGTYICNSFTAKQLCFLRSTISLEFKNSMLCLTKLNCVFACWDLECQRCSIDDIGVLVYHVLFGVLFSDNLKYLKFNRVPLSNIKIIKEF